MATLSIKEYQRKWRSENVKKCSAYEMKYRAKDPEKWRKYQRRYYKKANLKDYHKKWRSANKEKVVLASKNWRGRNPQKMAAITRAWRLNNLSYVNRRERNRCATDLAYKLTRRLRQRVRWVIRDQSAKKAGNIFDLVGCNPVFLMGYLEARFRPGMEWSNYGKVWEIDHLFPCASYDFSDPAQQRSCFHYTNLQPLFVSENRRKKDKIPGVSWSAGQ